MRFLFLDDSGKASLKDHSKYVVFAGFSVDENNYHGLCRKLNGAKKRFYPDRGAPDSWELKSTRLLGKNDWKRKVNREFASEIIRILTVCDCSVYAAIAEKASLHKPSSEEWLIPLMIQRLVLKYLVELKFQGTTGVITCDWSTYQMDRHISRCVSSMVGARKFYELRGGVSYGSSQANPPIQIADSIAGCFRRTSEGQTHLASLRASMEALGFHQASVLDADGYRADSIITVH